MATRLQEELGLRLRNWGRWIRGGMPSLEARNGIWADAKSVPCFVEDAQQVEFCITSWRQGPKPPKQKGRIEKQVFLLKVHYCDVGTVEQKRRDFANKFHTQLIERTYFRMLDAAESDMAKLLPPAVGPIVAAIRELKKPIENVRVTV